MILTIAQANRSFVRTAVPDQRGIAADVLESKRARLLMLCYVAAGLDLESPEPVRNSYQLELPLEDAHWQAVKAEMARDDHDAAIAGEFTKDESE